MSDLRERVKKELECTDEELDAFIKHHSHAFEREKAWTDLESEYCEVWLKGYRAGKAREYTKTMEWIAKAGKLRTERDALQAKVERMQPIYDDVMELVKNLRRAWGFEKAEAEDERTARTQDENT